MQRYFMHLSYKGTNYFGWQVQPNQISVQEEIEAALTALNSNQKIGITGCGRTDTGVHASKYYAHFDFSTELSTDDLTYKLNTMLPRDIAIHKIYKVGNEAHARFDATSRTYHYFIHFLKDPFLDEISLQHNRQLDIEIMNKAGLMLKNHQDFECFSKVKTDVSNFNCEVSNAVWIPSEKGIIFSITANRFLRNMVRAIVGTMLEVGEAKISLDDFQKILNSKNRSEAGLSVPAKGLFLADIQYPYID